MIIDQDSRVYEEAVASLRIMSAGSDRRLQPQYKLVDLRWYFFQTIHIFIQKSFSSKHSNAFSNYQVEKSNLEHTI